MDPQFTETASWSEPSSKLLTRGYIRTLWSPYSKPARLHVRSLGSPDHTKQGPPFYTSKYYRILVMGAAPNMDPLFIRNFHAHVVLTRVYLKPASYQPQPPLKEP